MNLLRRTTNLKEITKKPYKKYPNARIRYFTEFKHGFALAVVANKTTSNIAIINENFEVAAHLNYLTENNIENVLFDTNLIVNCIEKDKSYFTLLDKELAEIQNIQYSYIQKVDDEYILIYENEFIGIMNKKKEVVLEPCCNSIKYLGDDLFLCEANGKKTVLDAFLQIFYEIDDDCEQISTKTSAGLRKFKTVDGLCGYFDEHFKIVIQPKYVFLGDFDKNGLAPYLTQQRQSGVVDTLGIEFL